MRLRPALAALAFSLAPVAAAADVVTMANGDRLTGDVVSMADGQLVLATTYNGEVSLPWADVADLETDGPIRLRTASGALFDARVEAVEDDRLRLAGPEAPAGVALTAVEAVNPPEPGLKTTGFVNAGASVSRGNTEAQSYNFAGEVVARLPEHRFILGGEYYREEDDGELSVENARAYGRYARFLSERWYLGGNVSFEHDPFRDLDLRTTVGLGAGYQVYDRDDLSLSFEAGANYVREDLAEGDDESYPAARFAADYQQSLWDGATLFHSSELLPPVEEPGAFLLNTRTGVRVPLMASINGTFQVDYDYDNDPPAGSESADILYMLKLGYAW